MSDARPRILFVTSHCPHGVAYGGQLRVLGIGRLLQQCGSVQMVLVRHGDVDNSALEKTQQEFDLKAVIRFEPSLRGVGSWLRREFDPYCPTPDGVKLDKSSERLIQELVASHDVVWFHGLQIPNSLPQRIWPKSILDLEDVPSQYHCSAMRQAKSLASRVQSFRKVLLWKRRERVLLNRFSALSVCSEADRVYLGGGARIFAVPNGFDFPQRNVERVRTDPPRIGFVGNLNYEPNAEGVKWFLGEVWPRIRERCAVRLRLIGLGSDSEAFKAIPDLDRLGQLPETADEIATWSLMIVPIRIGGGTRIKIAEAFSRKCPVVSTTWGAFGYDVRSGQELLLADEPEAFAEACVSVVSNSDLGNRMTARAWERFCHEWSWTAIGAKVAAVVEGCLRVSTAPQRGMRRPIVAEH